MGEFGSIPTERKFCGEPFSFILATFLNLCLEHYLMKSIWVAMSCLFLLYCTAQYQLQSIPELTFDLSKFGLAAQKQTLVPEEADNNEVTVQLFWIPGTVIDEYSSYFASGLVEVQIADTAKVQSASLELSNKTQTYKKYCETSSTFSEQKELCDAMDTSFILNKFSCVQWLTLHSASTYGYGLCVKGRTIVNVSISGSSAYKVTQDAVMETLNQTTRQLT